MISEARPIANWLKGALALVLVLLTACGTDQTPLPPTPTLPTKTPKPTYTLIPSSTPTSKAVPTPTSTDTGVPATPRATQAASSTPVPSLTPVPTATPDPWISPLTGLRTSALALLRRRVLAARIGNDPRSRPQEGLGQADIVYEEIMDGWTLTRFTALYLDSNVERIRPIRSARLSSLSIIPQYDAAHVHSGASDTIRWRISQAPFVDLDEFFHPQPYGLLEGYDWRGRMYTSVERVHEYLAEKGLERETPIKGYTFDELPPVGQPAASIHIPYPDLCVVDWRYDLETGRYVRFVQGEPHLDGSINEQIAADNVIIFYAEHKKTDIVEDSLGSTAIDIVMTGSGRAQVCRDDVVIEGKWVEPGPGELIQYYDTDDELIPLRPGKTWIQLVPTDYEVKIN